MDKSGSFVERTWNEAYKKAREESGISKGAFSTHFRELIKKGSVKGKVIVNDKNRISNLYEYVCPPVIMVGETRDDMRDALRLTVATNEKGHKRIVKSEKVEKVRKRYPKQTFSPMEMKFYYRRKKKVK